MAKKSADRRSIGLPSGEPGQTIHGLNDERSVYPLAARTRTKEDASG